MAKTKEQLIRSLNLAKSLNKQKGLAYGFTIEAIDDILVYIHTDETIKILNTAKDRLKEAQEKSPDEGDRVSRICLHDEIIDKILAELK